MGKLLPGRTRSIRLPTLPACCQSGQSLLLLYVLCPESFQGNLAHFVYKLGSLIFSIFGQFYLFHQVSMDLLDHHWASLESVRAQCGYSRCQMQPLVSLWFRPQDHCFQVSSRLLGTLPSFSFLLYFHSSEP